MNPDVGTTESMTAPSTTGNGTVWHDRGLDLNDENATTQAYLVSAFDKARFQFYNLTNTTGGALEVTLYGSLNGADWVATSTTIDDTNLSSGNYITAAVDVEGYVYVRLGVSDDFGSAKVCDVVAHAWDSTT